LIDILHLFNQDIDLVNWDWTFSLAYFLLMQEYKHIVSSAKRLIFIPGFVGMSLMNILNSSGDRQEPYGTPALIFQGDDVNDDILTAKVRSDRKLLMRLMS